jgi:hypothetical protein
MQTKPSFLSRTGLTAILLAAFVAALACAGPASAARHHRPRITVYRVCHLSSRLGRVHYTNVNNQPTAYWTYGNGSLHLIAFSNDGDTAVDVAGVVRRDGSLADVAGCGSSKWIRVGRPSSSGGQNFAGENAVISLGFGYISPITPDGPGCAGPWAIDGSSGVCTPRTDGWG